MAFRIALAAGCVLACTPVLAAEPVRIGVTTILSGQYADRGQSEQYGVELALERINEAGGVLGRPVEAFYGDNAADPATGIAATKRLIEEQHVPVLLGALWTPVTHAIMPIVAQAKMPLVIDISAGQDFVDASGVGGNDYAFKTIPSDRDIALGLMGWLKRQGVHSVAIVSDDVPFNRVNADSMEKAAVGADIKVLTNETIAKDTKDLAPMLTELKALAPDQVVTVLSGSTAPFFRAYEQAGWNVPITGRIDFAAATGAVSPQFLTSGGLDGTTSITVFNPLIERPACRTSFRPTARNTASCRRSAHSSPMKRPISSSMRSAAPIRTSPRILSARSRPQRCRRCSAAPTRWMTTITPTRRCRLWACETGSRA
jgi:branched-chain amino acid transport system substrate-binding protein